LLLETLFSCQCRKVSSAVTYRFLLQVRVPSDILEQLRSGSRASISFCGRGEGAGKNVLSLGSKNLPFTVSEENSRLCEVLRQSRDGSGMVAVGGIEKKITFSSQLVSSAGPLDSHIAQTKAVSVPRVFPKAVKPLAVSSECEGLFYRSTRELRFDKLLSTVEEVAIRKRLETEKQKKPAPQMKKRRVSNAKKVRGGQKVSNPYW